MNALVDYATIAGYFVACALRSTDIPDRIRRYIQRLLDDDHQA